MLDQDTKRRIDTARDILVGKLPNPQAQVEQITIAMIYKFMDDMDKESVEFGGQPAFFVGEYEKYSWTNIFDPKLGGVEMLILYSEAIAKLNLNPNLPLLFREIFKNAFLPYRDPETLKMFLKVINEFHYDHSEKLGDAFEYLLSVLGSQGDAGQFRTPRHIIDFIVDIIQPQKNESICDPACGTAGFLISAYKHILKHNTKQIQGDLLTPDDRKKIIQNFVGYDISAEMVRLSLVNLYLHGFTNPKISEYDTLTSEERWGDSFDIILANPPFMTPKGGIRPHKKFAMQANRSEVLFVDYIMEHINPTTGRAAIIVPEGIIFQSATAYKALRKMLIDNHFLYGVVSLPAGIFQPYSGVKTSILLLDKTLAKKTDNILFLKIENDGFGLGAQRKEIAQNDLPDAAQFLKQYHTAIHNNDLTFIDADKLPTNALIVEKNKIAEKGEYNLSGDRYKNEKLQITSFEMVRLGDICEFKRGPFGGSLKKEIFVDSGYLVYEQYHAINNDFNYGRYFIDEDKFLEMQGFELFPNDIIISCSGTMGKVAIVPQQIRKGIINQALLKLTLSELILPQYLKNILESDEIQERYFKNQNGAAIQNVASVKILKEIQIPLPPLSIQQEIVAKIEQYEKIIAGAKQVVENYKPQIDLNPDWEMVELGSVCEKITDGTHTTPSYTENGVPFLRVTDITESNDSKKYISAEEHQQLLKRCSPEKGDVLYTKNGTIGIAKEITWDYEFSIFVSLALLKPKKNILNSKFLEIFLNTPFAFSQATSHSKSNTITNLHLINIKQIKVPKISLAEQAAIVSQIEKEQALVNANKALIAIYEQKIKAEINKLWTS